MESCSAICVESGCNARDTPMRFSFILALAATTYLVGCARLPVREPLPNEVLRGPAERQTARVMNAAERYCNEKHEGAHAYQVRVIKGEIITHCIDF